MQLVTGPVPLQLAAYATAAWQDATEISGYRSQDFFSYTGKESFNPYRVQLNT